MIGVDQYLQNLRGISLGKLWNWMRSKTCPLFISHILNLNAEHTFIFCLHHLRYVWSRWLVIFVSKDSCVAWLIFQSPDGIAVSTNRLPGR
jgi:hypothetical protein